MFSSAANLTPYKERGNFFISDCLQNACLCLGWRSIVVHTPAPNRSHCMLRMPLGLNVGCAFTRDSLLTKFRGPCLSLLWPEREWSTYGSMSSMSAAIVWNSRCLGRNLLFLGVCLMTWDKLRAVLRFLGPAWGYGGYQCHFSVPLERRSRPSFLTDFRMRLCLCDWKLVHIIFFSFIMFQWIFIDIISISMAARQRRQLSYSYC